MDHINELNSCASISRLICGGGQINKKLVINGGRGARRADEGIALAERGYERLSQVLLCEAMRGCGEGSGNKKKQQHMNS